MATMMLSNHYHKQPSSHYGYTAPPSPPLDDSSKISLPSISNLLDLADQGSPTSETSPQNQQQQAQSIKSEPRPNSSGYVAKSALPPSPPMTSDASFDGHNSPSTRSVSHVPAPSQYYYESTPESEIRQHMPTRVAYQPQHHHYAPTSYVSQPAMTHYYPPMQSTPPPQSQISSLYYQRPLPQTFPPMHTMMGAPVSGAGQVWQHHHYISPSSAASFPQSQDRYICQTCNKAFSRPSSLRIHSHSHTGEKPFKCPHAGCGKAFSVRSNMKRHERGCHNFESSSSGSAQLS